MPLHELHREILDLIIDFLPPPVLCKLALTCWSIAAVVRPVILRTVHVFKAPKARQSFQLLQRTLDENPTYCQHVRSISIMHPHSDMTNFLRRFPNVRTLGYYTKEFKTRIVPMLISGAWLPDTLQGIDLYDPFLSSSELFKIAALPRLRRFRVSHLTSVEIPSFTGVNTRLRLLGLGHSIQITAPVLEKLLHCSPYLEELVCKPPTSTAKCSPALLGSILSPIHRQWWSSRAANRWNDVRP